MQSLLEKVAARVTGDASTPQTPVQAWLEKTVTSNSTARVTIDDISAMKVWAHTHGWNFVEQIVMKISTGAVDYMTFLGSMQHLKAAHKAAILLSLRQISLPANFYETTRDAVYQRGGNAVVALYKLAQVTVARLWFVDDWAAEICSSFFSVFVGPWLSLVDIVRMDTAVPRSFRATWVANMRALQTDGIDAHPHSSKSIEWVRRRCPNINKLLTKESARSEIKDTCLGELPGLPAAPPNADGTPGSTILFPELRLVELGAENATHCQITTTGLANIVRGCPKLVSLNLMHCDVTDNGMRTIARHCPRLVYISVKYCSKVTNVGLLAVVQACPLLCDIDLSWCNKLTDETLKFIGTHCPNLTSLDLSLCTLMTDHGIKALVKGTPHLRFLSLYACKLISDYSCRTIAQSCPGMETLKLSLCEKVTNLGVSEVARGCPNLVHLNLSLCELVTDDGILEVVTRCHKLKIVNCYGERSPRTLFLCSVFSLVFSKPYPNPNPNPKPLPQPQPQS